MSPLSSALRKHKELSKELASLRIKNKELQRDLTASEELHSENASKIEALEARIVAASEVAARLPGLEKELEEVKAQLVGLQDTHDELERSNKQTVEAHAASVEAHAASVEELASLDEKSKELERAVAASEKAMTTFQSESAAKVKSLETKKMALKWKLAASVASKVRGNEFAKSESDRANALETNLEEAKDLHAKDLREAKALHEALQDAHAQLKEGHKEETRKHEEKHEASAKELASLGMKHGELGRDLAASKMLAAELQSESALKLQAMDAKLADAEAQLAAAASNMSSLRIKNKDLERDLAARAAELEEGESTIADLRKAQEDMALTFAGAKEVREKRAKKEAEENLTAALTNSLTSTITESLTASLTETLRREIEADVDGKHQNENKDLRKKLQECIVREAKLERELGDAHASVNGVHSASTAASGGGAAARVAIDAVVEKEAAKWARKTTAIMKERDADRRTLLALHDAELKTMQSTKISDVNAAIVYARQELLDSLLQKGVVLPEGVVNEGRAVIGDGGGVTAKVGAGKVGSVLEEGEGGDAAAAAAARSASPENELLITSDYVSLMTRRSRGSVVIRNSPSGASRGRTQAAKASPTQGSSKGSPPRRQARREKTRRPSVVNIVGAETGIDPRFGMDMLPSTTSPTHDSPKSLPKGPPPPRPARRQKTRRPSVVRPIVGAAKSTEHAASGGNQEARVPVVKEKVRSDNMPICKAFQRGRCYAGKRCKFAHVEKET